MGEQADDDPGPGEAPRPGGSLPELLPGFEHGGGWDAAAPSAALAAALETAAGPRELYDGAEAGPLVGIARQWAAIESWAAAGTLGALRAMTREDGAGRPLLRRRLDLPDGWTDNLNYQIAAALAMGPVPAGHLAGLAWTLGLRRPGIGRLLADGALAKAKARLIIATFEPLDEDEAARAEALIVGELAGKTWFQVQRLAWRAALAAAPDAAERRRAAAEKRRARVTVFREESGAAGLPGRDLPTAQAPAGHASVLARAESYAASGAFPDHTTTTLQALAYLHLLNNITTEDATAFARTAGSPDNPGHDEDGDDDGEDPFAEPGRGGDAPGNDDTRNSHSHSHSHGHSHDDDDGPDGDDDDPGGGGGPGGGCGPGGGNSREDDDPGDDDDPGGGDLGGGDLGGGPGPGGDNGGHDGHDDNGGPGGAGGRPVLPEVTAPLGTLQGRAKRPGETRLLGPLDPALTRDLANAAARSPHAQWEVTTIDDHGHATGHGIARPRRGKRHQPQPPGPASCALPARVNITVSAPRGALLYHPLSG